MNSPRVPPLAPDELDTEQAELLGRFTNREGQYPNVFGTLARHMKLVNAWEGFGMYTMQHSQVDPVLREVAILRTAVLVGSEYEWSHHCDIGRRLGMTQSDFDAIRRGEGCATVEQQLMVRCANDLLQDHCLSDAVWAQMQEVFDVPYTLDVIFTVGAYITMGMALNSCGVELE